MFESITTTAAVASATTFAAELQTPLLIVGGIAVAYGLGNWIYRKVKRARS